MPAPGKPAKNKTLREDLEEAMDASLSTKKPLRGKSGKFQKKARPFGSRPGATTRPESRPVEPKVPGTMDQPRRRRLTTDPSILRGRQREA